MIGNKDSCQAAAHEAAEEAKKNLLGKPDLVRLGKVYGLFQAHGCIAGGLMNFFFYGEVLRQNHVGQRNGRGQQW